MKRALFNWQLAFFFGVVLFAGMLLGMYIADGSSTEPPFMSEEAYSLSCHGQYAAEVNEQLREGKHAFTLTVFPKKAQLYMSSWAVTGTVEQRWFQRSLANLNGEIVALASQTSRAFYTYPLKVNLRTGKYSAGQSTGVCERMETVVELPQSLRTEPKTIAGA